MSDKRNLCYPFIHDRNDHRTDYEVLTDGLTSEIAFARSLVKDEDVREDLKIIIEQVLHLNPMTRKENDSVIECAYNEFNVLYDKYNKRFDSFYLPLGDSASTAVSALRKQCKIIIRLLVENENKNQRLLDCFNILTNIFHLMWIHLSDEKIEFKSKSYK